MRPNELIYNHKFHFNAGNFGTSLGDSFNAALAEGRAYEAFVYNASADVTVRVIIDTLETIIEGEDPQRATRAEIELEPQSVALVALGILRDKCALVVQNVGTSIPDAFDVTVKIRCVK